MYQNSEDRTPTTLTRLAAERDSPTPTLLKIVRGNPTRKRIDLREPRPPIPPAPPAPPGLFDVSRSKDEWWRLC